jgi:hypothetical protein
MTGEAHEYWNPIYNELTKDKPGIFGGLTARSEPQTLRLALIYALLDRKEQIDVTHINAALAMWRACEASVKYIFGDYLGDPVADSILRALRAAGSAGLSRWDITSTLFSRNVHTSKIQAGLGKLMEYGKIRRGESKPPKSGGPPKEMWYAT